MNPMAYSIKYDESVTAYIRDYPWLSREGRVRLFANINADLRDHADLLRQESSLRTAPDSLRFWYRLVMGDEQGDGRLRQFSFVVDDSAAAYGLLQVEYVDVIEARD